MIISRRCKTKVVMTVMRDESEVVATVYATARCVNRNVNVDNEAGNRRSLTGSMVSVS